MKSQLKSIAMGLAIAGLAIYIYNKVPQVKSVLGGA